jgi:cholinesterase
VGKSIGVVAPGVFGFLIHVSVASNAYAQRWDALYTFGDSYTDSGAGYLDGNGPTAVVYLAASLGIPFTHANDPNSSGKGLNFAVSGAQTGKADGVLIRPASSGCGRHEALLGRGMRNQVLDFAERVKSGALRFNPNKTLFFLAGGLNDTWLPTATTIENLEEEIREIHDVGGRYFLVAIQPTKIPAFSAVAIRLNPAITKIPGDLRSTLSDAHIEISRWGEFFDQVIEKPAQFGITNTSDRCAGRELFGEDPTPCAKPDAYFYFHEGHPSTAVQRIVGRELEHEVENAFPTKTNQLILPNGPFERRR